MYGQSPGKGNHMDTPTSPSPTARSVLLDQAVAVFQRLQYLERQVARAQTDLEHAVSYLPADELSEYAQRTERMRLDADRREEERAERAQRLLTR